MSSFRSAIRAVAGSRRGLVGTLFIALPVVVLTGLIYWPVVRAGFVWDDKLCFHDAAWLHHGDDWKHFIFSGFCDWSNYFRPLVVALFALELHIFDVAPGPMHLVSLALHLANTILVGLLATRLVSPASPRWLIVLSMLLYGLHPALIEPVVWIGCQAELTVTLLIVCGLLLNASIHRTWARAVALAGCFLLAALAKESAVCFPPLLVLFDLATCQAASSWRETLRAVWNRQWSVYFSILAAGLLYLGLRHWALGSLVDSAATVPFLSFPRMQEIAFIYVTYLRTMVWPMFGLAPIHMAAPNQFASLSLASVCTDILALATLAAAAYWSWRRKSHLLLAVTICLLPVLHIVPVAFDESLYHERYAMTALAVMCALLPSLAPHLPKARPLSTLFPMIAAAWLVLAVGNIRVTLPLWSDDVAFWRWALKMNPDSLTAKDRLLSAYIDHGDRTHARELADTLVTANAPCPQCMLAAAFLALSDADAERATAALSRIAEAKTFPNKLFSQEFVMANGRLLELRGDLGAAEQAYRDATKFDPNAPLPRMTLALLLAKEGRAAEARQEADTALPLFAPDEREPRRRVFEQTLATSTPTSSR